MRSFLWVCIHCILQCFVEVACCMYNKLSSMLYNILTYGVCVFTVYSLLNFTWLESSFWIIRNFSTVVKHKRSQDQMIGYQSKIPLKSSQHSATFLFSFAKQINCIFLTLKCQKIQYRWIQIHFKQHVRVKPLFSIQRYLR